VFGFVVARALVTDIERLRKASPNGQLQPNDILNFFIDGQKVYMHLYISLTKKFPVFLLSPFQQSHSFGSYPFRAPCMYCNCFPSQITLFLLSLLDFVSKPLPSYPCICWCRESPLLVPICCLHSKVLLLRYVFCIKLFFTFCQQKGKQKKDVCLVITQTESSTAL